MMNSVDNDMQFLVHFFDDKEYLIKAITMVEISRVDEICNRISSQKGWYWPRIAGSERRDYTKRRFFVDNELYEDYSREYGCLKEKIPVYFYLYPHMTKQKAMEMRKQRLWYGETEPHVLMVKIDDIKDTRNITCTLNDSHTAYWKRAVEAGITCAVDGFILG